LAAAAAEPVALDCHLGGADEELRWRIVLDESAGTVRQEQRGGGYASADPAQFTADTVSVATPASTLTLERATLRLTRSVAVAGRSYSGSCTPAAARPVTVARAGSGSGAKSR
jgi:hypothetical protein